MLRKAYMVLLLILFSASVSVAQTRNFTVSLDINVTDSQLKSQLTSYMSRELRGLGDVSIVNDGMYAISILAIRGKTKGGTLTDNISVSMLVTRKGLIDNFLDKETCIQKETIDLYKIVSSNLVRIENSQIYTGDMSDIEPIARNLVADINTETFEPIRRIRDELKQKKKDKNI